MFDFRYHVASLAAVFLALVVGIVIGVGLSGQGIVQESEREALNNRIRDLQASLDSARTRDDQERAATAFVEAAYPAVMENRLAGRRIAVVFAGQRQGPLRSSVAQAIADARGRVVRLRALKLPVDEATLLAAAEGRADGEEAPDDLHDLGRLLGRELLAGGPTPLWDAVAAQLVIERIPDGDAPADGVVVVRTVPPQPGATGDLLNGLYAGLTGSVPAVWVDNGPTTSRPEGFAVLRDGTTALGWVTLVVLLETGVHGDFGPGAATVVPPIAPVSPPLEASG